MKFEDEGSEFAKFLRSQKQFIQTVKGQHNLWLQNAFLTCSWRFLIYDSLEQLEFKLELGFRNMQEKLENTNLGFSIHFAHPDLKCFRRPW